MEQLIKNAPAMQVVSFSLNTNLTSLKSDVGNIGYDIVKEAVLAGFHPTGPQYWIYLWESTDPSANFNLKIALPVSTFGLPFHNNRFNLEHFDDFKHVAKIHYGAWENLKEAYGELMQNILGNGLIPTNQCREVYINCDFEHPVNNVTEIQFGIQ